VATEQDAARDRVLAARADLDEQLDILQASGRSAIDIPAKIRRSPAKAAAVAGGAAFLALKGPQRLFGRARRVARGPAAEMPKAMLPEEIERTLRSLGDDGDRVRGALERDFAAYAQTAHKGRDQVRTLVLLGVIRPVLFRVTRAALDRLFAPDQLDVADRLAAGRGRADSGDDAGLGTVAADIATAAGASALTAINQEADAFDAARGSPSGPAAPDRTPSGG
jgi:hypothetical protein